MSRLLMLLAGAALLAGACKSDEGAKTQGLPPATDWNAPAPGGAAQSAVPGGRVRATGPSPHAGQDPGNPHAGLGLPAPNAGGAAMGAPANMPGPDPNRAIDPNKYLEGTLTLDSKVQSLVAAGSVVFLSVKVADPKSGAPIGTPLAVERLVAQAFPLPFRLTERNAMTRGTGMSGSVVITAWTDKDQDASTKEPGDILGSVRATVPAKGLTLVLDTVKQ